ncbi:MAG: nucleotide exchange factor GrpE [Burkholderiales bacterium]|nr:nucleotide exchange factor GrpE [Burkholderiales bacterium]
MQDFPLNQESAQTAGDSSETPGSAAAVANEVQPESMPGLQELLRKAELQAQEHHDAWLRAKAETENVRRRAQADVANAHKFGVESFANALLPVKDSLEAALAAENNTVESIRSGVEITLKQLAAAFDKFSLTEINPVGEKFDPHRHEAMTMIESEQAPNTVVQVLQKGYALHERVVRPALVCVARGKQG